MMGMGRSFASMTVSRQLAPTTGVSATLSASEAGTGLVIASNRDFGKGLSADFNFIVGPSPGLSFACSKVRAFCRSIRKKGKYLPAGLG